MSQAAAQPKSNRRAPLNRHSEALDALTEGEQLPMDTLRDHVSEVVENGSAIGQFRVDYLIVALARPKAVAYPPPAPVPQLGVIGEIENRSAAKILRHATNNRRIVRLDGKVFQHRPE